jgi:hypothetical protein
VYDAIEFVYIFMVLVVAAVVVDGRCGLPSRTQRRMNTLGRTFTIDALSDRDGYLYTRTHRRRDAEWCKYYDYLFEHA